MKSRPYLWFLLPMLAYIVAMRIAPLLYSLFLSFHDWNLIRQDSPVFTGFDNYHKLITDGRFHNSLFVSFFFMIVATGVEVVLGTCLALLVNRDFRGKGVLRGLLVLPMFLNPVAVGTIWYILFEPTIGPLPYFLEALGFPGSNILGQVNTALWGVFIADLWEWTPFVFVLVLASLQGVPKPLIETAQIDGASGWKIVTRIHLPLVKGTIVVAALLRAMDAFRVLPKIYVMTGGGPANATESASLYVLKTAFRFFELGYATSMTVIMLVLLMLTYALYLSQTRRGSV